MTINIIVPPDPASRVHSLRSAITTNPVLGAAIKATAPTYLDLDAQLDTLVRTARDVEPIRNDDDLAQQIATDLAAGKPIPTDLLTQVAQLADGANAWTRASTMLNGIAADLTHRRDEALRSRTDAILTHLHDQLAELIAQVPVDAPATAEDAIASGDVDTFTTAQAAAATYVDLRKAQAALVRAYWAIETHTGHWPVLGAIANPTATWGDYLPWQSHGYRTDKHGNRTSLTPPWPALNTPEALPWLATHPDAEPWVPTREQYAAAVTTLDLVQAEATRPAPRRKRTPGPIAGLAQAYGL